jgi:hypothetical protein
MKSVRYRCLQQFSLLRMLTEYRKPDSFNVVVLENWQEMKIIISLFFFANFVGWACAQNQLSIDSHSPCTTLASNEEGIAKIRFKMFSNIFYSSRHFTLAKIVANMPSIFVLFFGRAEFPRNGYASRLGPHLPVLGRSRLSNVFAQGCLVFACLTYFIEVGRAFFK